MKLPEKLDLGCGRNKRPGFYGVDINNYDVVDQQMDLNDTPWDIPSNHFKSIVLDEVLEHLKPEKTPEIFENLDRIAADGCTIFIRVPHVDSIYYKKDPTHQTSFSYSTIDYYTKNGSSNHPKYCDTDLFIVDKTITFESSDKRKYGYITERFKSFANKYPEIYELFLSSIIRPNHILITLKKRDS